jgi:hypothetical protein
MAIHNVVLPLLIHIGGDAWEEVSAIGEVPGSIAVFITLGYLAVQIGHARGKMRRSISQNRSDRRLGKARA